METRFVTLLSWAGNGGDFAFGISVDRNGDAYVTGFTRSLDFPLKSPIQKARGGDQAAFLTKIDRKGKRLLYSTYLGGKGDANAIAIASDANGNAFVTGFAGANFPNSRQAVQKTNA